MLRFFRFLLLSLPFTFLVSQANEGFSSLFIPTPMKVSAPNWLNYSFDGAPLSIPVTLSGTPGLGTMLIFTSGKESSIHQVRNGNLGWHYVDNIDTCLYVSPQINFSLGANTVTWDGKDENGHMVPAGEYAYYLWAYDSMDEQVTNEYYMGGAFITHDENGNPLSRPLIYSKAFSVTKNYYYLSKKIFGDDPILSEKTSLPYDEYFRNFTFDPNKHSFFYNQSIRQDGMLVTRKWQWVPNGNAILLTDWANNGESAIPTVMNSDTPHLFCGPISDNGENLFFTNAWNEGSGIRNGIVRMDILTGDTVNTIDMTARLSDPKYSEYYAAKLSYSNGMMFCISAYSTLAQMIDPYCGNDSDPIRWEISVEKDSLEMYWGAAYWNICSDSNNISFIGSPYSNCFELIAPDGTDSGFFPHFDAYKPYTPWQDLTEVIDTGSPYDGLYFSNGEEKEEFPISYRASDSFRGLIGNFGPIEPSVTLLDPGGNEALKGGSERYITWTSQGVYNIRIEYSLDDGAHWQTIAESVKAAEQRYLWTVPNIGSNACRMRLIDTADSRKVSEIGMFAIVVLTGVGNAQGGSPRPFFTLSNYPNPFNPSTTISFTLPQSGEATLTVYDITGRKVRTLIAGHMNAGAHSVVWDGRDERGMAVSSGVYLSRLESGSAAHTAKMLLIK